MASRRGKRIDIGDGWTLRGPDGREFAARVVLTMPGPNGQRWVVLWRGRVTPKRVASAQRRRKWKRAAGAAS